MSARERTVLMSNRQLAWRALATDLYITMDEIKRSKKGSSRLLSGLKYQFSVQKRYYTLHLYEVSRLIPLFNTQFDKHLHNCSPPS